MSSEIESDDISTKITKVESFNGSSTAESSDSSFDFERCSNKEASLAAQINALDTDLSDECMAIMGQRPRLPAFCQATGDAYISSEEKPDTDDLSLCDKKTEFSLN